MRRLGLVLTGLSAVALALIPSPAKAQTEPPSLGCIPTSDTPVQTDLVGPLPPARGCSSSSRLPRIWSSSLATSTRNGTIVFAAGIPPGTYPVRFFDIRSGVSFVVGYLQIGNCAPTSKDQCKNGGWRNYPQFTNQGSGIAFFTTAPRRAPLGRRRAVGVGDVAGVLACLD